MLYYLITGCFLFITAPLFAQLCQGSLGDPIVNITFGAGGNPGAPLAAATTTYQYLQADCPNDGYYTVRNNTSNCFGSTWHSLSADHTGDPNGYFMLVNASYQPGAFYIDTVKGLCANTTYEFAAWVMNILKSSSCNGSGILPNLTFSLEKTDGTILQSYNTGAISSSGSPIWNQYGFFFTTPPTLSDIVLRIVNNAPGGCGNDLALDDITFRPCGPGTQLSIVGETTNTVNVCRGIPHLYNFISQVTGANNNSAFQWQQRFNGGTWTDITGANAATLSVNITAATAIGNYDYRLAIANNGNLASVACRAASTPLTIIVNENPDATIAVNSPVCNSKSLLLQAGGGTQYLWTGPNGFTANIANPEINNVNTSNSGIYMVKVTNEAGCSNTGTATVTVQPSPVAAVSFSDTTICEKNSIQLLASGGGNYRWNPAAGLSNATIANPVAKPVITTNYRVIVSNSFNCTDTASVNINIVNLPVANAGPDKTSIGGTPVLLEGSINGQFTGFNWSPATGLDNAQLLQPNAAPLADAAYVLTADAIHNCGTVTDTVFVKVYKDIYIPNAFTPGADGKNDTWNIPALNGFSNFTLSVYNRYGQLVFNCHNTNKPWDGKYNGNLLPAGSYIYYLNLPEFKRIWKGTVLLIR